MAASDLPLIRAFLVVYVRGDQIMRRSLVAAVALLLAHSATQAAFIQGILQATGYLNDTSDFTGNAWIAIDYQKQQRHETIVF